MIRNDISGIFFKYVRIIELELNAILVTFCIYLLCYMKNIKLKKYIKFYGFAYFFRYPGSKINIHRHCIFRSKKKSNLIGINHPCYISTLTRTAIINIGKHSSFSSTVIGAFNSITIGVNVRCGANTLITDGDWHMNDPRCEHPKPVIIENNVWLGEGVKVLKGVIIGENSVIGAGSIVTKSIPPNVIAAGNPCKVIKELNESEYSYNS